MQFPGETVSSFQKSKKAIVPFAFLETGNWKLETFFRSLT